MRRTGVWYNGRLKCGKEIIGMMKRSYVLLVALFCSALAAGCATRGAFVYIPGPQPMAARRYPARVAVKGFLDQRGNRNRDYTLMTLIPLWPWGKAVYERPEAGTNFIDQESYLIRPSEDFARALIADLRYSGMFQEVFYTEREAPPDADLIVEGVINSTRYEGKTLSYGLSVASEYMWLLGLPMGKSKNEVELGIRLIDAKDGRVLWRKSYGKETSNVGGLYYNTNKYCSGYPEMIRQINRDVVQSMAAALGGSPPSSRGNVP